MIKVNLQNTAVQNMLTGQNTLDSYRWQFNLIYREAGVSETALQR